MMLFRNRKKDREATSRLARWALSEAGALRDLERQFGREHAEELGSLGWLFRAIESEPRQEPSLGLWQRFERELRLRLQLLPPPRASMAVLLPPLFILPMVPGEVKAAVGVSIWKAAAMTSATAALSMSLLQGGAALRGSAQPPAPSAPCAAVEYRPTGNAVLDHVQRNRIALEAGEGSLTSLLRATGTPPPSL